MYITYDKKVIDIAEKIMESPTATRGDIDRLIHMSDHKVKLRKESNRERMPRSNYLGKEAIAKLRTMAMSLPTRIRK